MTIVFRVSAMIALPIMAKRGSGGIVPVTA